MKTVIKRISVVSIAFFALLLAFLLSDFLSPYITVEFGGNSMLPTYKNGDLLTVKEYNGNSEIKRFDVVVFKPDKPDMELHTMAKRIVGMPHEKISFADNNIYINDKKLEYPHNGRFDYTGNSNIYILKANEYFVVGDNVEVSLDSRTIGPIHKRIILGIVVKNEKRELK